MLNTQRWTQNQMAQRQQYQQDQVILLRNRQLNYRYRQDNQYQSRSSASNLERQPSRPALAENNNYLFGNSEETFDHAVRPQQLASARAYNESLTAAGSQLNSSANRQDRYSHQTYLPTNEMEQYSDRDFACPNPQKLYIQPLLQSNFQHQSNMKLYPQQRQSKQSSYPHTMYTKSAYNKHTFDTTQYYESTPQNLLRSDTCVIDSPAKAVPSSSQNRRHVPRMTTIQISHPIGGSDAQKNYAVPWQAVTKSRRSTKADSIPVTNQRCPLVDEKKMIGSIVQKINVEEGPNTGKSGAKGVLKDSEYVNSRGESKSIRPIVPKSANTRNINTVSKAASNSSVLQHLFLKVISNMIHKEQMREIAIVDPASYEAIWTVDEEHGGKDWTLISSATAQKLSASGLQTAEKLEMVPMSSILFSSKRELEPEQLEARIMAARRKKFLCLSSSQISSEQGSDLTIMRVRALTPPQQLAERLFERLRAKLCKGRRRVSETFSRDKTSLPKNMYGNKLSVLQNALNASAQTQQAVRSIFELQSAAISVMNRSNRKKQASDKFPVSKEEDLLKFGFEYEKQQWIKTLEEESKWEEGTKIDRIQPQRNEILEQENKGSTKTGRRSSNEVDKFKNEEALDKRGNGWNLRDGEALKEKNETELRRNIHGPICMPKKIEAAPISSSSGETKYATAAAERKFKGTEIVLKPPVTSNESFNVQKQLQAKQESPVWRQRCTQNNVFGEIPTNQPQKSVKQKSYRDVSLVGVSHETLNGINADNVRISDTERRNEQSSSEERYEQNDYFQPGEVGADKFGESLLRAAGIIVKGKRRRGCRGGRKVQERRRRALDRGPDDDNDCWDNSDAATVWDD